MGELKDHFLGFSTQEYKNTNAFMYVEYPDYGTFLGFGKKDPELKSLPFPLLDWNSSEDQIKAFEEKAGRKFSEKRKDDKGRDEIIYGTQTKGKEFDEVHLTRYLMQSGKLVKVVYLVAPANYVFTPMGEAFSALPTFESYVQGLGYTKGKVEGKTLTLYSQKEKGNKFTLRIWNIKFKDGRKRIFAGLEFVPLNGPDIVE